MNAIWVWNFEDANSVADRCISGKIDILILHIGHWNTDGTINYDHNTNEYKTWVNTAKSINQNFKVLGCVICVEPWTPVIDISSQNMRIKMVNEMVNCVNTLNLDGFNDDVECTQNYSSLLDLWNRMGTAMRNINKLSSACIMNWGDYVNQVAKYVDIDYLFPMCYNGGGWTDNKLQTCIHNQLVTSNSPLIIGLGQYDGPSLSNQLLQKYAIS